ncbi:MAG: CocE/NonD family hydrolase C-terminal non-catalytic domain-containing protein, partial [Candidatus Dormibacteria bacterium]
FCRLCDVDRKGKSTNICDGIIRLTPDNTAPQPDGTCQTVVEMWPTAYRFKAGDRVRLQVSSGSHPRFARNTGTGEPLATTTTLVAADQEVFHGPLHPSALVLPVRKSH